MTRIYIRRKPDGKKRHVVRHMVIVSGQAPAVGAVVNFESAEWTVFRHKEIGNPMFIDFPVKASKKLIPKPKGS